MDLACCSSSERSQRQMATNQRPIVGVLLLFLQHQVTMSCWGVCSGVASFLVRTSLQSSPETMTMLFPRERSHREGKRTRGGRRKRRSVFWLANRSSAIRSSFSSFFFLSSLGRLCMEVVLMLPIDGSHGWIALNIDNISINSPLRPRWLDALPSS